ncbi:MAG: TolC family protein [Pseudomonadota bacterium]
MSNHRQILVGISLSLCLFTHAFAKESVTIAIVLDGPIAREFLPIEQIISEINDLSGNEFDIKFPESKILNGNWQVNSITEALQSALSDPEIDLIIANGLLATNAAANITTLTKPVIGPVVADRVLQNLPYIEGSSGKNNFVYVSDNRTVGEDLQQFYQLTPYQHLAVIVDRLFLDAIPELKGTTYGVQQELGFQISFIPVADNPVAAAEAIPADVDAVYIPPLLRFDLAIFKQLADKLIEKRLVSFSLLGREELEMGILATLSGREIDTLRYARRIALNVQSILLGTNAAELKVALDQPPKLAINMRTANAIGFSPTWESLEIADLLYADDIEESIKLGLVEAVQLAIKQNIALKVEELDVELSKTSVKSNLSPLLPQIDIQTGVTQIDRDRAGLTQAQRSTDADLSATQVIYSETLKSNYDVSKLLESAASAELKTSILDVISNSATAYLQTLLAHATEQIQRSNLQVSETNLELAESRLKIGYSDRSEVLRWESQIATDRQNLYLAQASKEQLETELKRQINFSLDEKVAVSDAGISNLLTLLDSDRFQRFFNNPKSFEIFTKFEVNRAIVNAPELEQTDFLIASNERELLAAKRAYYIPDIQLNTQYGSNIERGGVGSNNSSLNDDEWSVGVQASIPLFAGGSRSAEVARANNTLIQNRYQRQNIKQQIEARVFTALQQASGSYPAIRLSKNAAEAASENLSLVTDSYSQGILSITDLIDAQDATLAANLSAAEAQYNFMIDWIEIQRAVANFDLLLTSDGFESWYQELDEYYSKLNQ